MQMSSNNKLMGGPTHSLPLPGPSTKRLLSTNAIGLLVSIVWQQKLQLATLIPPSDNLSFTLLP